MLFFFLVYVFTLISINSQGLRNLNRRHTVFNLVKHRKYDVIFLQETHWTDDLNDCILREWGGNILFNNFEYNARGTAILFSPTFDYRMYNNTSDPHGRTVQTLIEHADRKFNLINIYAPNTNAERRVYFHSISTFISSTEDNILGGDFNCIADHKLDKLGGNPFARQTAITILNTITQQHNLTDIWRDRNRDVKKFTWTGKNTQNSFIHTRIDKFFISSSLTPFVTKTDISPFSFSDHDLIMLTFDLHTQPRGEGYWLFNNNLLDDDFFVTEINHFWTNWLTRKNDFNTPLKWWDTAKHNFKNIAVKRSTQLSKCQRQECRRLENKLQWLQRKLADGDDNISEAYLQAKNELQHHHLNELAAIAARTKIQYAEEGEKSTRYFYSLENNRKAKQTIKLLTKNNLDTITETQDIITETHSFYTELYTAQKTESTKLTDFLNITTPILTQHDCNICEGHITENELRTALQTMENNKSPGLDGLSTNFYKHFWPILGHELTHIYNYAFDHEQLPLTQRRGVISLLFKKGDRTQLQNWRPITLLNTDYKILSKVLANRLKHALPLLVHTDQTACIPGRTINDNLRLIQDAIAYANETDIPLALISVDQLKAFDRVSHSFLFKTLEKFGFGPDFRRWIRLLYTHVASSVKVNGWLTAFIPLQRGLRQGCALSMPLYVLTAEILATHIRAHPNIRGLQHPASQPTISQYADDTTLLLADDDSITNALKVFKVYEEASGAKLNLQKCKGLWCGAYRHRTDAPTDFDWTNKHLPDKLLGIYVGNTDCTERNVEYKIHKLRNITATWMHRNLSLKGKALLINGLLTSTLWYHAANLHFPTWAIQEIEDIIYNFLWDGKRPLINRDIIALPLAEGGLNIPRIAKKIQALRLNSVRRLLSHEQAHWKYLTSHFLRLSNMPTGKHTFALNYDIQHIDPNIPHFHRELLAAWLHHANYHTRTNPPAILEDILQEPLFKNPLITVNSNTLYYRQWIKADIITVKDICYSVIPGFMPALAIHEILTQHNDDTRRSLQQTIHELTELQQALPSYWTRLIRTHTSMRPPTLQPMFVISNPDPNTDPVPLENCRTKHFYHHLQRNKQTPIPSLNSWQMLLPAPPVFNHAFWKNTYPTLNTNKQGDVNWKIAHRVLPTALSLYRATVYHTPNCHRCHITENIEHIFLYCPSSVSFWTKIRTYIDKMTNNTLRLTDNHKLFGLPQNNNGIHDKDVINLINWTLTTARCAIHKSAVDYRTKRVKTSPKDLFAASVKAHITFLYKYSKLVHNADIFTSTWCISSALASLHNKKLVFHL